MSGAIAQAIATVSHQQRVFVEDYDAFVMGRDPQININEHRIYWGMGDKCWDQCCNREICDPKYKPWPEVNLVGPYLRICERSTRQHRRIDHPYLNERRVPLYFSEPIRNEDDLVYVDLNGAYWQIYTRTTLDVFYDGERYPQKGVVHFLDIEELRKHKKARNAIIGSIHRMYRTGLDHGVSFEDIVPPYRRRPDLWGLVQDCLHTIAWSARDLGAVYIHTDGAIFTGHEMALEWIDVLKYRFGILASIRAQGPGTVYALGRWRIGDEKAGKLKRAGQPVDNMIRHELVNEPLLTEWLLGSIILPITPTTKEHTHV